MRNLASEKVDPVSSDLVCSNKARYLDFYVKSWTSILVNNLFSRSAWAIHGDGGPGGRQGIMGMVEEPDYSLCPRLYREIYSDFCLLNQYKNKLEGEGKRKEGREKNAGFLGRVSSREAEDSFQLGREGEKEEGLSVANRPKGHSFQWGVPATNQCRQGPTQLINFFFLFLSPWRPSLSLFSCNLS